MVRKRTMRSPNINFEMSVGEEENNEVAENTPSFQEFDDKIFNEEEIPDVTQKQKLALQSGKPKRAKNSTFEDKNLSILNQIEKELKQDSETKETQDEECFYGQTAAASIRKLGNMEKCMIKHEINNILFKYQMSMYKAENTASTSQRITYPTPPTPTRFSVVTFNDFNGNIAMHEISHKPPHMATDSLCNQLTHLTNIKRKKHIFYAYTKKV